jgi:hypothetical protein
MCHWYFVQIYKLVSNSNEKITVFYVALDGKFTVQPSSVEWQHNYYPVICYGGILGVAIEMLLNV